MPCQNHLLITGGRRAGVTLAYQFWGPGFTFHTTGNTLGQHQFPESCWTPCVPSAWLAHLDGNGISDPEVWPRLGNTQVLRHSLELWGCILTTYFWLHPLPPSTCGCLMSGGALSTEMGASPSISLQINKQSDFSSHIFQASHMIVSYDEHDVKNTFKFGVIYQKAKQVSTTNPYWSPYPLGSHWGLFISSPKYKSPVPCSWIFWIQRL